MTGLNVEKDDNILDFDGSNNDINNSKDINIQNLFVSGKVLKIIEEGNISDKDFHIISKFIYKTFNKGLNNLTDIENISVFSKYLTDLIDDNSDDTLDKKIQKYFPIHFNILINSIKIDVTENKKNIKDELYLKEANKNTIKNAFKKYSYIIYVFGEKIKIGELRKIMGLNLNEVSVIFDSVSEKLKTINVIEENSIKRLKELEGNSSDSLLLDQKIFDSTFRNIFRKVASDGKEIDINTIFKGVSIEIEKIYKIEFQKFFEIFKKWINSDGIIGDNLFNLENIVKKILYGIDIFKNTNIAFTDNFYSNSKQSNFINEVFDKLLSGKNDKNKKLFKKFIEIAFIKGGDEKYLEFIYEIQEGKKIIAESRVPDVLHKIKSISLDSVTFDAWSKLPETQKYERMFSQIISNNGKIFISEYLKLFELNDDLIKLFTESHNISFNTVKSQFREILELGNNETSLEDFIKKDINNLNLIIIWWRFILKVRTLDNEGLEINLNNINSIEEKPYGVIEKISNELKIKGILDSNKLNFNPEGRLENISVETITEQLKSVLNGFKKGPIDLLETKVKNGDIKTYIRDIVDLYIPINLSYTKNGLTIEEESDKINHWIGSGIDLCYKILGNDFTLNNLEKEYLIVLQKYNIVPEDLRKLKEKEFENIQDLVETLKLIKNRRKKLLVMLDIANNDKTLIKGELSGLFNNESKSVIKSGFGPNKTFTRGFVKLIKLYSGDFTSLGDLTRLRIIRDNINELVDSVVNFISLANDSENISHISIIDTTGEPISSPKKKTGYRDIKLLFTLKNGNVVELQFQYKEMLESKEIGINLETSENDFIFDKIKKEESLFTKDDLLDLFRVAKKKNIELPTKHILNKLLLEGNIDAIINEAGVDKFLFTKQFISTDYTYNISKLLHKESDLNIKLTKLERVIADHAWSKTVVNYLKYKKMDLN